MTDLAVIIVNWNTRDLLRKCLASLYHYTNGISYDVFVVDNASSDGSPEMVTQEFPSVRLIRNYENVGFSKANNQAIRLISSRYVLLLNSDTDWQVTCLNSMVGFMDTHLSVGICSTKLLNPDGTRQYSCDLFPRTLLRLLSDKFLDRCCPGNGLHDRESWLSGITIAILRLTILSGCVINPSPDSGADWLAGWTIFMYAEDIDWCYRAALAGWETYI